MTARPNDSIQEIALRLAHRKIGAIVIVGDNGKVDGIISERDIIRLIAEHGAGALAMPASGGMTREVVSCRGTNTLEEIMEMMTKGRFRHLAGRRGRRACRHHFDRRCRQAPHRRGRTRGDSDARLLGDGLKRFGRNAGLRTCPLKLAGRFLGMARFDLVDHVVELTLDGICAALDRLVGTMKVE